MRTLQHLVRACSLAVAGLALGVSPAWSAEVWLEARPLIASEYPADIPSTVPMWGYASCVGGFANCATAAASVPGPQLIVPVGETSLTIHLRNSLPAAGLTVPNMTSIVIPGQRETAANGANLMVPVMITPEASNPHDGGAARSRMRSFTHETLQGTDGDYIWSNLKPGTYLYHSGTHAQVQVQMGLYGSVKADAAAGQAYAGQAYASDATLLFSEIDPALHTAVAGAIPTYGTTGPTSTINYQPKYFLMNGAPYQASTLPTPAGQAGQRVLLRLLNAGLESHVATLLGGHFQVIAEDGNPLAHPRDQYETLLPAAKTMDAIWVPAANGTYSLYDRRNRQGMLAKLEVGGTTAAPIAVSDAYSTPVNTQLSVAARGVLLNDQNAASPATAVLVTGPATGLTLNADGSFTYNPDLNFFGQVAFTYKVNNNGVDSNVATVTILVNRPPVAVLDTATTQPNQAVTVNVLANDSDPENQPLTITAATSGANGAVTFTPTSVVYTPNTGYTGPDTFTYTISDGQSPVPGTAIGTVNVTVSGNTAPVANPDPASVAEDGTVTISVLANDTDADVPAQPLTVTAVTQGVNGALVTTNGTTVTYKPALNFNGADSFTYTVSDGQTPTAGTASGTVNVTVTAVNDAPVAVANVYAVNKQTIFTVPAPGVLLNDSDVDGNPLTAVQRSNPSGTVSLNANGSFTYTTTAGYVGTRVFKYRANDGSLNSADVNVTLVKDLTVTSIASNNANTLWIIRGKSTKPNTTVTVYLGASPTTGTVLGTATVGGNGSWRLDVSKVTYPTLAPFISVQSSTGAELIEVPAP